MRTFAILGLCAVAFPAAAAERSVGIGSFDRLRVAGPFAVVVTAGSPSARVSGGAEAVDAIEVRLDGTTLTVRRRGGLSGGLSGGMMGSAATGAIPLRIVLATPALASVSSMAGATIAVAKLRGQRVELTVAGSGAIAATAIDAGEVRAVLAGAGRMTLAGRATKARLTKTGEGTLDADTLDVGDLLVAADGIGAVSARARYNAQVSNAGTGEVVIAGTPRCVVRPANGGPVTCGAVARR